MARLSPTLARLLVLGAVATAAAASPAWAAPPEVFSEIALHPSDPDRIVLAYVQGGQGLLFSNDGGQSFALRCGSALSSSFTKSRAPLASSADGQTLLGTFEGLVSGSADGCGFASDPALAGLQVADFARDPRDPAVTFAATANALEGRATGLVRRNADGSFTPLGADDTGSDDQPGVAMNRLGITLRPDGGLRFYASALREDAAGNYHPIVRHSDDEGASWVSFDVPGAEGARVLLVGVDPTHADRLAIAISRDAGPDSVLVSSDAGQSFEPRLEIFELGASSVAPDGRLWVGDAGGEAEYSQPGGLYVFDDFAAPARKLATFPVRCLAHRAEPEQMFACQRSTFGRVDPETGSFTRLSSFGEVAGFVACEGEALAPLCQQQLCDNWCGVLHYASAPLCDAYSEVAPLCGPSARSYGQAPTAPAGPSEGPGLPAEPFAPGADAGTAESPPLDSQRADSPEAAGAACRFGTPREPAGSARGLTAAAVLLGCVSFGLVSRRSRRRDHGRESTTRVRCNPNPLRRH